MTVLNSTIHFDRLTKTNQSINQVKQTKRYVRTIFQRNGLKSELKLLNDSDETIKKFRHNKKKIICYGISLECRMDNHKTVLDNFSGIHVAQSLVEFMLLNS